MKNQDRRLSALLLATLLTTSLSAATAFAGQDGQDEGDDLPPIPEGILPERGQSAAQEMAELIAKVERNLTRIDVMLNDAGAGDIPLEAVDDSGLDDLLRSTKESSSQVVSDIDRILQIAQEQGGGSMQGSLKPQQGQGSPLDEPRDQGPKDREQTPGEPQGQKEEPGSQGQKPQSPGESQDEGATRPGGKFDPETGEPVRVIDDAEEWGMLPPRMQELFRNEGRDDLPVQYRDWIDAYYRRLNQER